MKIFKDNVCYVEVEDLTRFPLPYYVNIPIVLNLDTLVGFKEKDAIDYFKDRQDILDYNLFSKMSYEDLDNSFKKINAKLDDYCSLWLNSSLNGRKRLDCNEEYRNTLKVYKAISNSLDNYIKNKKVIDFDVRYYFSQGLENEDVIPNFFNFESLENDNTKLIKSRI